MRHIIPLDETKMDLVDLFSRVDATVDDAVREGSVEGLIGYIRNLNKFADLSGKALARLLYRIQQNWHLFIESESDDFKDYMAAIFDMHPHSITRLINIAKMFEEAPQQYLGALERKNNNELFPVANALDQGWSLDDEDWKDYIAATTRSERLEIVRQVKGVAPRRTGIFLWLTREGELIAFHSEHERVFVGSLELDSDNPVVQKAIARIIKQTGIREE